PDIEVLRAADDRGLRGHIADDRCPDAAVELTVGAVDLPPDAQVVGHRGVAVRHLGVILGEEATDRVAGYLLLELADHQELRDQVAAAVRLARAPSVQRRGIRPRVAGHELLLDRGPTDRDPRGETGEDLLQERRVLESLPFPRLGLGIDAVAAP